MINDKNDKMQQLNTNLHVLKVFKNTKEQREAELENERMRFDSLKKELEDLKQQGKIEMAKQKERIEDQYNKFFVEFKKKASSDAEKNISAIERNIQAHNHRLEDEAQLQ